MRVYVRDLRTMTPAEDGWRAFIITEYDAFAVGIVFWLGVMVRDAYDDEPSNNVPGVRGMISAGSDGLVDVEDYHGARYFFSYLPPGEAEPADRDIEVFRELCLGVGRQAA